MLLDNMQVVNTQLTDKLSSSSAAAIVTSLQMKVWSIIYSKKRWKTQTISFKRMYEITFSLNFSSLFLSKYPRFCSYNNQYSWKFNVSLFLYYLTGNQLNGRTKWKKKHFNVYIHKNYNVAQKTKETWMTINCLHFLSKHSFHLL